MPLITIGYTQRDLDSAYQQGYADALYSLLEEVERRLPGQAQPRPLPATAHTLAALIISHLNDAQAVQTEIGWLRRWEADLRADPLLAQVQRARQELKDEQAQCAELTRDLTQTQKQLREEKAARLTDVRARDTRIAELNDLVARLTLKRLEPADEVASADEGGNEN
jgi:hypothetical protein